MKKLKLTRFKRLTSLVVSSALLFSCAGQQQFPDVVEKSTEQKIFSLPYHLETLDNGLRLIVVKTDYPDLVSLHIPMQTGSRNEVEPGKSGFAHFFEHMMFKGTPAYPQDKYSEILKNAGVDGNAYTSDDLTNYHISFPKEHLETMLMLEADRFQNLHYSEAEFRTEALAVKGEYLKNASNPYRKMFEGIRDLAFNQHTYQHTTMGFLRDIEQMPEQFDYSKVFFKRWYRPQLASVIVVGDVDIEKTKAWVKKYWGVWQGEDIKVDVPVEPAQTKPIYQHLKFENSPSAYLTMAFKGPALDEEKKDKPALDILREAYFSNSSELYKQLVIDRQWVQSFGAYFPDRKDPQLLYIYAELKDEKFAENVKTAIAETLIKARSQNVDAQRLADIKNNLKYAFANTLDSTDSIASTLASYVHFERDPEFLNRLYQTFSTISTDDIKTYASSYFTDQNLTLMTMSPKDALPDFDPKVEVDTPSQKLLAKIKHDSIKPAKVKTLYKPTRSDLIDVNWWFNSGTAQDPKDKKGLAALTAMMISEGGSSQRSYPEIQQAMYPLAAGFSSSLDKEMLVFGGSVHKDNLPAWYALVSEQLLSPGFRQEDFTRLKDQLINNIENGLKASNDEELGKEVLYEAIYQNHAYGSLNLGHLDDIKALTLEDVKNFYQTQLTQDHLTLALSGNFPQSFGEKILADMSALAEKGQTKPVIAKAAKVNGRQVTIVEKETLSTAVSFGFPIEVKRGDPDWVALWLVRSWLGEHRNSNSYLYQRIRQERGMNYGDYAYIEYFPSGMFLSKPQANRGRSEQIFQVWIRPLRSVNDAHFATRTAVWEMEKLIEKGLTQEQFESTRNFLFNYVPQLVDSQGRILGYAIDSRYYGIDDFVSYVRSGLEQLTLEQVNKAIVQHLQLDNMQMVFISKQAEELKNRLATNQASAMTYNSEKSAELMAEDQIISAYDLKIKAENIVSKPLNEVFK